MYRTALLAALLTVVVLPTGVAAGGGGAGLDHCAGFGDAAAVTMKDNCFDAVAHFSDEGTVTVINAGAAPHTYTAVDGAFDTGTLEPGDHGEVDAEPGIHRVYCTLHSTDDGQGMAGVLIVGDPELAAAGLHAVDDGSSRTGLLLAGGLLAVFGVVTTVRRRTPRSTG